ncbi:hypothetical protein FKW77_009089 [Venturia effusa]|uniref:Uncharacterized protein n=1 Tax=Venturia effusa TaxID=50376 RepID=A0A517L9U8_9PEZI|nr:hypothetical protein FKW77_009089 [Venturia effusa]
MHCYTPKRRSQELVRGGAMHSLNSLLQISSRSVRSAAGGSSRTSDGRAVTQTNRKSTPSKRLSAKGRKIGIKQPNDKQGEDDSDDDHAERSRPPKRKRGDSPGTKNARLPCIFHVLDPSQYAWGEWKHCNPDVSRYPDPSAMMRHLERRHDIDIDDVGLRREDSSPLFVKTAGLSTKTQVNTGRMANISATNHIVGFRQWRNDPLITEEDRYMSRQLWAEYQQRARLMTSDADRAPGIAMSTVPGPFSRHSRPEIPLVSPDPFPHGPRVSPAQPSSVWPVEEDIRFSRTEAQSSNSLAHLHPQRTLGPTHASKPSQDESGDPQYPAQWQLQSLSTTDPQRDPWSHSPVADHGEDNLQGLMARLILSDQRTREEKQRLEEENRRLKELVTQQEDTINRLSIQASDQSKISDAQYQDKERPMFDSTSARSNSSSPTASDLSGIAERQPHNLATAEEFNNDLFSEFFNIPEQDMRDVQYLPTAELGVRRASQGMPSDDSGYGTHKTGDSAPQYVRPGDTIISPIDPNLTFSHT